MSKSKVHFSRAVRRRWRAAITVLALVGGLLALSPVPPAAAEASYSQTVTLPVPPASSFIGNSGGDGWDLSFDSDRTYNIFHHNVLRLACLNQVDATSCWSPQLIQDGTGRTFYASQHSGADLDSDTGLIYTYTARTDGVGGVLCLDPTAPDQAVPTNPYCGFEELTAAGQAQYSPNGPGSPMLVGDRYYAYNFNSGTTGDRNKLMCFDFATDAPCAGQPYAIDFGGAEPSNTRSATVTIDEKILVTNGDFSGATRVACFDPGTDTECAGSWPAIVTDANDFNRAGPPFPVLNVSGNVIGTCLPGATTCIDLTGSPIAAPPGFPATMGGHYYTGGAVVVASRIFTPGYSPDRVDCYDYSTQGVCNGFPKNLVGASLPYTVNTDPFRPTCIWVNSDNGSAQIQTFDAFDGGACGQGSIRVLAAQFVVDEEDCFPSEYESLEIITPASSAYTSATVAFQSANGNPIGIPDQAFSGGIVDLSGLGLEAQPELPQFVIDIVDPPADLGEVTLRLTWSAAYDPACSGDDTEVDPEPTDITPEITGGGQTGTDVTVEPGDSATAGSTLTGENAPGASGTVTYTWYSDDACTTVASQGSVQDITTPGTLPDSEPVTLPVGVYYVIADYSGDDGNDPSTTACGDAVLTVKAPNEAPTIDSDQGEVSTPEGTDATNTGTYVDPDGDDVTLSADVGTVVDNEDGTWAWSNAAPDGPAGPYTVTITADDGNGETDTTTFTVAVVNVAPEVEAGPDQSTTFGGSINLDGGFGDPGTDADWTVDIDWGDGSSDSRTTSGTGAITDGHQYLSLGDHTVEVCVTDKDGATGCDTTVVTVTTTDGKVTGGPSTSEGGKTGFNVQSDNKGLKGNLQYSRKGLKFHANTMTALAVSQDGTSAWFAGTAKDGTSFIAYTEDNGEPGGNDVFMLWIDGVLETGDVTGGNVQIH